MAGLSALSLLTKAHPSIIALNLPTLIPCVSECMHDTKKEVSAMAIKVAEELCRVVGNPDLEANVSLLVGCMAHPEQVSLTVQKLSSTTFVAEVTGPALAVIGIYKLIQFHFS